MQPARGRFARFEMDRQIASTSPAHWLVAELWLSAGCLTVNVKVRGQTQSRGGSDVSGWLLSSNCQLVA